MNPHTKHIIDTLRQRADFSARRFLVEHPRVDYRELGSELGFDAPPIRLMDAVGHMLSEEGDAEWFMLDLFVRRLHQRSVGGWSGGEFNDIRALVSTTSVVAKVDPHLGALAERTGEQLLADKSIPRGWMPDSADDPILVRALEGARRG